MPLLLGSALLRMQRLSGIRGQVVIFIWKIQMEVLKERALLARGSPFDYRTR